ncbi:hypothetical protein ACGF1Z_21600 [Streptomyces sp. NPDC048018]|uniref:hypothetical protein n=1 Tax=Streptomyces sp. NPDC048018 TaxID=3365499 RepID=UPI003710C697
MNLPPDVERGDVRFPDHDSALAKVLRRYEIEDPSYIERVGQGGKNPNLHGPKGEPWELIRAIDSKGNELEFYHHANGHYFKNKDPELEEWPLPHYHDPKGEHVYHGDTPSAYGLRGVPRNVE